MFSIKEHWQSRLSFCPMTIDITRLARDIQELRIDQELHGREILGNTSAIHVLERHLQALTLYVAISSTAALLLSVVLFVVVLVR